MDGTAPKAFFRLKPTDLPIPSGKTLDTADFDNDGISNIHEIAPPPPLLASDATDPINADTDGDTMSDGFERASGLDPNDDGTNDPDNGLSGDPDGDGLSNAEEILLGSGLQNTNSDGDALDDGEDADPMEILVDWEKAPESSYLLIDIQVPAGSGSAQDLNDKAEVLFDNGIWAGGEWIAKNASNINGVFPDSISENFPDGIGYQVSPTGWNFFNNDRHLLQTGWINPTEGPGVDSAAPVPVFWPGNQSSASHVYATADLWENVYWSAWAVGVSTVGEMVTSVSPQHPPTGTTIATERLDRFNASGTLIGSMDGSGGFHPSVSTGETSMMSGSGWVAARLVRAATATQPVAEKLGFWSATNALVALPPEADGRAFPVHLTDLPNSKVGLVAGQVTATDNIERVFLPDAQDQMQYSPGLSAQKLRLFAGDGTAMTSTYEVESDGQTTLKLDLWRNGKLIPLRDLCPAIGELLDGGYRLFPKKANKHGVYLVEAQGPNDEQKVFVAKPMDIVPDDNMVGLVGDVVQSVVFGSRIKHFVSPKMTTELAQTHVILKATGLTAEQITPDHPNQIAEWDGGEAVANDPLKRRVTRAAANMESVKIKSKKDGTIMAEMRVWILWVNLETIDKTPKMQTPVDTGTSLRLVGEIRFRYLCSPSIMFDLTTDIPSLNSPWDIAPPGGNHPWTGVPLAFGADIKIDATRQMRVKSTSNDAATQASLQITGPDVSDYPADSVVGNDDPSSKGEVRPYDPPGITAKMTDFDTPFMTLPHSRGSATPQATVSQTAQFKQFARVELGARWYKCSNDYLSELHLKAKRVDGKWIDDKSAFTPENSQFPPP